MTHVQYAPGVPLVPWSDFRPWFAARWEQGEHVTLLGPTGSGKTTLGVNLLAMRAHVLALATKPRDDTMSQLLSQAAPNRTWWETGKVWRRVESYPGAKAGGGRYVVWPKYRRAADVAEQGRAIRECLDEAFAAGGWTIFADELWWLANTLGSGHLLEQVWSAGRSVNVTLIGGSQQPAHIPVMAYSAASHLFLWRDNDERRLRRLGEIGGVDSAQVRRLVASLPRHHALYVGTRDGTLAVTRSPRRIES